MGKETGIAWCDHTFNPWWGCTRVSRACKFCYADTWAQRFGGELWGQHAPRRFFDDRHWQEPHRWNRAARRDGERRRVFVASMADLFESLPQGHPQRSKMDLARERLWGTIEACSWLDWLILTKRPGSVGQIGPRRWVKGGAWPLNAWLGTSVEDDHWAQKRIPLVLRWPAPVHFVSYEPAVGPVQWREEWFRGYRETGPELLDAADAPRIDWLICGGESGDDPGVAPMHPDWARAARDVCQRSGSAFFFKQWGQHRLVQEPYDALEEGWAEGQIPLLGDGTDCRGMEALSSVPELRPVLMERVRNKSAAGDLLDGVRWQQFPETPAAVAGVS